MIWAHDENARKGNANKNISREANTKEATVRYGKELRRRVKNQKMNLSKERNGTDHNGGLRFTNQAKKETGNGK